MTTELRPTETYLQKEIKKLSLDETPPDDKKENTKFSLEQSLAKCIKEPFCKSKIESMYIVADLGTQ